MPWEDRERNKVHDVRRVFAAGKVADWWVSHGGRVVHRWWCSALLAAPGVAPADQLEGRTLDELVAAFGRRRLCGWCCYAADRGP